MLIFFFVYFCFFMFSDLIFIAFYPYIAQHNFFSFASEQKVLRFAWHWTKALEIFKVNKKKYFCLSTIISCVKTWLLIIFIFHLNITENNPLDLSIRRDVFHKIYIMIFHSYKFDFEFWGKWDIYLRIYDRIQNWKMKLSCRIYFTEYYREALQMLICICRLPYDSSIILPLS